MFVGNSNRGEKVENYRKSAHATYDIKYHIVWITKYCKMAITGKIAERTRELTRQTTFTFCRRTSFVQRLSTGAILQILFQRWPGMNEKSVHFFKLVRDFLMVS